MSSAADPQHEKFLEEIQRIVNYIEGVYRTVLNRPPELAEAEKFANAIYQGLAPMDFFDAVYNSNERRGIAKIFAVPGSYQSPIANPVELRDYVLGLPRVGPDITGISIDRGAMVALWEQLRPYLTTCPFPTTETPGFHYYSENFFFGFGDGLMLHGMLRHLKPKRLIEIGSGFSSACAVDTIDRFLDGTCDLTFIEPYPERLLGVLGERARTTRIFNVPVQGVPLEIYGELEAGDILFIDSSHVLRTGSDVCMELFEILPRLAKGVFVHIHDIIWPFEYPQNWILDQNRSYNEAYAVRAFLTENPNWKIAFFNDYFTKFEGARIQQSFPQNTGDFGGSIWLERC
jgi:hypothetical protein